MDGSDVLQITLIPKLAHRNLVPETTTAIVTAQGRRRGLKGRKRGNLF
jgi:hypothetical protein